MTLDHLFKVFVFKLVLFPHNLTVQAERSKAVLSAKKLSRHKIILPLKTFRGSSFL